MQTFPCRVALFFFAVMAAAGSAVAAPNYFTRAWQVEQGLPQNKVTAVVRAHDGCLRVGTGNGNGGKIRGIAGDGGGDVWFWKGGQEHGCKHHDDGNDDGRLNKSNSGVVPAQFRVS
ncbi:MAG TPA: hypothetical protein VFF11_16000, partial [Candidatus Binatia bacterium]|nr:hypothetical protein [Candidatus Binatia bacterium]